MAALGGSAPQHLGGYWGMVKRLDEALGRIQDALRSLNLTNDTILLFTSDHGCHFKNRNGEYKRSCHDSSVRIPTALIGGPFTGGGRVERLVNLEDLRPRCWTRRGCPCRPRCKVGPCCRCWAGAVPDWPTDALIQISESQVGRAVRTRRWKYSVTAPDKNPWQEGRADRYVENCLYDLYADPYELNNLIGYESHQPVAARLRERLIARMVAAGETVPTIELAPCRPSGQKAVRPAEIDA